MSQDFWQFFWLVRFDLGLIWTDTNDFATFFVFTKIFTKNMYIRFQRLRWHHVSIVNDYVDIESELSMTTMTCSQWLRETVLLWKKYKTNEKSNKKCNLIFSSLTTWTRDFRNLFILGGKLPYIQEKAYMYTINGGNLSHLWGKFPSMRLL